MRYNIKIPSQLKRLYGRLSIDNIERGIRSTKKILGFAKDIDRIAGEHQIDRIKNLTGKLVNNQAFNKLEKGVNAADNLVSAYNQSKTNGLFNKNHPNINKIGEQHAMRRFNENEEARRIVENVRLH